MIRFLAATLVFAHMWAFSAPLAGSAEAAEAAQPCEQVVGQNDTNSVTSPRDCPCCDMEDCCSPFTCTSTVTALLQSGVAESAVPQVTQHDVQSTDVADSFLARPLSPPPQA